MKDRKAIFADNLQYYTRKSGKYQTDIAEAIGVSRTTYSEWIHGRSIPRTRMLERLATYFNVLMSDLLEPRNEDNAFYMRSQSEKLAEKILENEDVREICSELVKLSKADIELLKVFLLTMRKR